MNTIAIQPILRNSVKAGVRFFLLALSGAIILAVFQTRVWAWQNVLLAWNPSPDEDVVGYNVYFGVASGGYTQVIQVGNVLDAEISGLASGATYHFAVSASDAEGNESPFSEEVIFTAPPAGPVALKTQFYLDESEKPFAIGIEANTDENSLWSLEYSFDLRTWSPYSSGTGANAFALVPFGVAGRPQMFFRIFTY